MKINRYRPPIFIKTILDPPLQIHIIIFLCIVSKSLRKTYMYVRPVGLSRIDLYVHLHVSFTVLYETMAWIHCMINVEKKNV